MLRCKPSSIIVLFCLVFFAAPAAAFHERGHMAAALIAYRQLDDAQKIQIQTILKTHPHYLEFLASAKPADAPHDEWVVMQASVWADWIKKAYREQEKGFNFPNHHYVNIPLLRLEGVSEDVAKQLERNAADLPKDENSGRILVEYPKWLAQACDPKLEMPKRAIALCWVFHLVGDIHQPLHAVTLFTRSTPKGDMGGNLSFVMWQSKPQNLHAIWDAMVGWGELESPTMSQYAMVDLMTRDLSQRYRVGAEERSVSTIDAWAKESRALAETEGYSFESKPIQLVHTEKFGDAPPTALTPKLPEGYGARARKVAERRVVLAGHRLADRLKEVAASSAGN